MAAPTLSAWLIRLSTERVGRPYRPYNRTSARSSLPRRRTQARVSTASAFAARNSWSAIHTNAAASVRKLRSDWAPSLHVIVTAMAGTRSSASYIPSFSQCGTTPVGMHEPIWIILTLAAQRSTQCWREWWFPYTTSCKDNDGLHRAYCVTILTKWWWSRRPAGGTLRISVNACDRRFHYA